LPVSDSSGAIDAAPLTYAEYAADRRGVAFTPTIATAQSTVPALSPAGSTMLEL